MDSASNSRVSIVTPVYNGERYLSECLDSVLAQTHPNWDCTIVNNCSTDRTLEIAEQYAARDSRIRVHSNSRFVEVISNFNIAVQQTSPQSKYCKVLAADDWLFPDCLEKMVGLADAHPTVAIVGSYGLRGTWDVAWQGLPYPSTCVSGRDVCRRLLLGGPYIFGTPTAVLYRADIVRSRREFYNEANFHADLEACLEFLEHADFGFVHQILHYRRVQEDSLTAYSLKINTYLAGTLQALSRFGPKYLSPDEMADRTAAYLDDYYRYLGRACFESKDRTFWEYHREKLAGIGYPLSYARVAAAACRTALEYALNPLNTTRSILGRVRGRRLNRAK